MNLRDGVCRCKQMCNQYHYSSLSFEGGWWWCWKHCT